MGYLEDNISEGKAFCFFRGRVALYAILKAMDIKPGDEVILQAFTCLAVPNPIVSIGASPVYVDIDLTTLNIDVKKIESRITNRTRAIITQHTYGLPADMEAIMAIAVKHGLFVIEDACHSILSRYKNKEIGTMGDAAFYSFEWGKPVVIGLGGCATINNEILANKMKKTYPLFKSPSFTEIAMIHFQYLLHSLFLNPASYWVVRDMFRYLSGLKVFIGNFKKEELRGTIAMDYNKRMSRFHKRLLEINITEAEKKQRHGKWLIDRYNRKVQDLHIRSIKIPDFCEPALLRLPVFVNDKKTAIEMARKKRIEIGDWFTSPVHPLKENEWGYQMYEKGSCPAAEEASKTVVTLPINIKVRERELAKTEHLLESLKQEDLFA